MHSHRIYDSHLRHSLRDIDLSSLEDLFGAHSDSIESKLGEDDEIVELKGECEDIKYTLTPTSAYVEIFKDLKRRKDELSDAGEAIIELVDAYYGSRFSRGALVRVAAMAVMGLD